MKKAKQAMTNSYGRIENSYKQQNAAKRRNAAKKRADYLTQGMVKQKTLNKMKKHYNKRLDKLENWIISIVAITVTSLISTVITLVMRLI